MRILVTGGAGFIGSNLVDHLLKDGAEVICLDNFDNFYNPDIKRKNLQHALSHKNFSLIEGDIRDSKSLEACFAGKNIDVVVHLAARAGVRPSIAQPELYYDVNVTGTLRLLEAMKNHDCKKLVFASSSSVYGNNKKVPFSETDNVDHPISPYAATKKAGELLCYTFHHLYGFDIFCLRFFTAYGPRQRPEMAIHQFTRLIYNGENINLFGDGSSRRDYTFIDDIIQGVRSAIDRLEGYEIINLGESNTISLLSLVENLEKATGKIANKKFLPQQAGDVDITYADISKAKSILGYNPHYPIEKGIKEFVDWYLKNL